MFDLICDEKIYWKISAKWANKIITCTKDGIINFCHGQCCKYKTYFPKNYPDDTSCSALTELGCSFSLDERPVSCVLFPFTLQKNNLLGMQFRIIYNPHRCGPCIGKGDKTILENLSNQWKILFGDETVEKMIRTTKIGKDFVFRVDKKIDEQVRKELDFDYKSSRNPEPRGK